MTAMAKTRGKNSPACYATHRFQTEDVDDYANSLAISAAKAKKVMTIMGYPIGVGDTGISLARSTGFTDHRGYEYEGADFGRAYEGADFSLGKAAKVKKEALPTYIASED